MRASEIAKLAATLTAGGITAHEIESQYGSGVLSSVLGFAGGSVVGAVAAPIISTVLDETGISDFLDELF